MRIQRAHAWNFSPKKAIALQPELREHLITLQGRI